MSTDGVVRLFDATVPASENLLKIKHPGQKFDVPKEMPGVLSFMKPYHCFGSLLNKTVEVAEMLNDKQALNGESPMEIEYISFKRNSKKESEDDYWKKEIEKDSEDGFRLHQREVKIFYFNFSEHVEVYIIPHPLHITLFCTHMCNWFDTGQGLEVGFPLNLFMWNFAIGFSAESSFRNFQGRLFDEIDRNVISSDQVYMQDFIVGLLLILLPILGGTSGVLHGTIFLIKLLVVMVIFLSILLVHRHTCVPWYLRSMIGISHYVHVVQLFEKYEHSSIKDAISEVSSFVLGTVTLELLLEYIFIGTGSDESERRVTILLYFLFCNHGKVKSLLNFLVADEQSLSFKNDTARLRKARLKSIIVQRLHEEGALIFDPGGGYERANGGLATCIFYTIGAFVRHLKYIFIMLASDDSRKMVIFALYFLFPIVLVAHKKSSSLKNNMISLERAMVKSVREQRLLPVLALFED